MELNSRKMKTNLSLHKLRLRTIRQMGKQIRLLLLVKSCRLSKKKDRTICQIESAK